MHHDDEKSGFIFLMALFVITGLASAMAVGLTRTMTEQLAARTNTQKLQAFHLADAGVDEALWVFRDFHGDFLGQGWTDVSDEPACDTAPCFQTTLPNLPDATHRVTVTVHGATGLFPTIRTDGFAGDIAQTIRVVLNNSPAEGSGPGLFGANQLTMGGTGPGIVTVDSYNSEDGPYDPSAPLAQRSHAVIGTNDRRYDGLINDNVVVDGVDEVDLYIASPTYPFTATVYGKISASNLVSQINDVKNYGTLVDGGESSFDQPLLDSPPVDLPDAIEHDLVNPQPDLVPDSLEALCGASPPTLTVSAPPTVVISTDSCYTAMNVWTTGRVILNPGVKIYLKGNGDPTGYVLQIDGGTIVAKGQNEIYGGLGHISTQSYTGFINDSAAINPRPKELVIRLEGSEGAANWLRQEAPFYGVVYIRRGFLWTKGYKDPFQPTYTNGEYFGAIVSGDQLSLAAHDANRWLKFHQDVSLSYGEIVGISPSSNGVTIVLWQQMP